MTALGKDELRTYSQHFRDNQCIRPHAQAVAWRTLTFLPGQLPRGSRIPPLQGEPSNPRGARASARVRGPPNEAAAKIMGTLLLGGGTLLK